MEQRISLITLGVRDLARSRSFYEALGWRGQEVQETVFFQAGGQGLVLWDRAKLAADCGVESAEAPDTSGLGGFGGSGGFGGFGGIALAHNVRSAAEVDELLATARRAAARITKPGRLSELGFYTGVFLDPDGHAWEIAHNPGFPLSDDGSLTIPDLTQDEG
ncbi:VOC family protein [Streptomyces sp. B-S-A8]|uniref:VOC family protein n=1 Tax=Streptomyces solicavernae TaxID=3043614 RepID=A0ABT6RKF3_9ACTN|nr:VOC family protein [Streptomyces sp. B-S-A8]MDI3384904.1 VOC family protein [Streptomyces sp. B-S-A8]